jgi:ribosomal protein L6P/L9E
MQQIYFLRLRLKGLGYRIKRFTSHFYRFYFTRTNYIYFHLPQTLIFKRRKKKIILLSTNYHLVRLVFAHLMLLHKVGPYNRRGFTYPRQIIFLKIVKKIV